MEEEKINYEEVKEKEEEVVEEDPEEEEEETVTINGADVDDGAPTSEDGMKIDEEEEEVVEEDPEEEEEETVTINGADVDDGAPTSEDGMKIDEEEEDESKKHAKLLALPPHGTEVHIGGIPQDVSEEDLRSFCEPVGEVIEVRIMKENDPSKNKGYAFATYKTKELVAKAIEKLDNTEFKGKVIRCSASQGKNRLFIGNIPRNWVEEDLWKVVTEVGPGVVKLDLMKDTNIPTHNGGFAFVEYYNHACANYSKIKMSNPKFKLDNNCPTVSWAHTKSGDSFSNALDSSSNSQVKAVYVKSLPKDVTKDQLKKLFEHHGEIRKIVLPPLKSGQGNRFAVVHFLERSSAMKALNTEKYEINGQVLECHLAKPPADKKSHARPNNRKGGMLGHGIKGGASGAVPGFGQPMTHGRPPQTPGAVPGFGQPMTYGRPPQTPDGMPMVPLILPDGRPPQTPGAVPGFGQPMTYGRPPQTPDGMPMVPLILPDGRPPQTPSAVPDFGQPMTYGRPPQTPDGMPMVPLILPDGRIAYVMQQPGVPLPQLGGNRGSSSSGWRKGSDNNYRRRYQPY